MVDFEILLLLRLLNWEGVDARKVLLVAEEHLSKRSESGPSLGTELVDRQVLTETSLRKCLGSMTEDLRARSRTRQQGIAEAIQTLPPEVRREFWRRLPALVWHIDAYCSPQELRGEEPFARGGLGQIWKVRDEGAGRTVLVKQLRADRSDDPEIAARFLAEGRVTAQLEHPNIVPVYSVPRQVADAPPYYVMRWVQGRTLEALIHDAPDLRRNNPARRQHLRALVQRLVSVCEAVSFAHSRGVIHRDIKPANIVCGDFGETHLLDWGLAKVTDRSENESTSETVHAGTSYEQTLPGTRIGTPLWMAPEQAEGGPNVDERSDVYCLGATLFDILTGQPPHLPEETMDAREVIGYILSQPTPRARGIIANLPPSIDAVCATAMAKDPSHRYQTVRDLTTDLQHWLADDPVSVHREPWGRRFARVALTYPMRTSLVVGMVLCLLLPLVIMGVIYADVITGGTVASESIVTTRGANERSRVQKGLHELEGELEFLSASSATENLLVPGMDPQRREESLGEIHRFLKSQRLLRSVIFGARGDDGTFTPSWTFTLKDNMVVSREGRGSPLSEQQRKSVVAAERQPQGEPVLRLGHQGKSEAVSATTVVAMAVRDEAELLGVIVAVVDVGELLMGAIGDHPVAVVVVTDTEGRIVVVQSPDYVPQQSALALLAANPSFIDEVTNPATGTDVHCQAVSVVPFTQEWIVCTQRFPYAFSGESSVLGFITMIDLRIVRVKTNFLQRIMVNLVIVIVSIFLTTMIAWGVLRLIVK
ncbi:Serine/threonine-protein kinase PknB [Planctomycetes bacterium Pan216]|uniref:Serine/threonine-protein kinase PknB n=1 Tax=Kolteria novifilia TaxID=2527975 RepID=A0A518B098_9BACT|nr:Serine/threonine-protein kinase PknB [Planctomycetes bacterium Pan216]